MSYFDLRRFFDCLIYRNLGRLFHVALTSVDVANRRKIRRADDKSTECITQHRQVYNVYVELTSVRRHDAFRAWISGSVFITMLYFEKASVIFGCT